MATTAKKIVSLLILKTFNSGQIVYVTITFLKKSSQILKDKDENKPLI